MAGNYTQLLDIINNPTQHGLPAWDNNAKQIEGETIQQYLLYLVNSLTVGYQFMGVASTNTSGGTPDQNVFYLAGAGTYNGFGSDPITINDGYLGIIIWNGTWNALPINIAALLVNRIAKSFVYYKNDYLLNIDLVNKTVKFDALPSGATSAFIIVGDAEYIIVKQATTEFTLSAFGLYYLYAEKDINGAVIKLINYTQSSTVDWNNAVILGSMVIDTNGNVYNDGILFVHKINGEIALPLGVKNAHIANSLVYLDDNDNCTIEINLTQKKVFATNPDSANVGYVVLSDGTYKTIPRATTSFTTINGIQLYILFLDSGNSFAATLCHYNDVNNYNWEQSVVLGSLMIYSDDSTSVVRYDGISFAHQINANWVNNISLNTPDLIFKGIAYMGVPYLVNIDLEQKKCIVPTGVSTPGYIAIGNGKYLRFDPGETTFTIPVSTNMIYWLFLNTETHLLSIVSYTNRTQYDWRKCIVLGLLSIGANSSGDAYIIDDQIPFAHKINGNIINKSIVSLLRGKRIAIFGDSISTYAGYIPSGNAAFFPQTGYDVNNVNYTWWKKLIDNTGMVLARNESWSGSRIATPPAGRTEKAFTNPDRYNNLNNPDIIIVFGGINDEFAQSDPTEIGEYNLSTNGTMDVTKFKQAYQFLVRTLQTTYPEAKLFICSPTFKGGSGIFEDNSAGINQYELHDIVRQIADYYGCNFIDLAKCGINVYNYQTFLDDTVHPNRKGMELIYEYVLKSIMNVYIPIPVQ